MSVIVAVIFMFPGVKAGRNLCCDVACRLCLGPLTRSRNTHTIEHARPVHDCSGPQQPEQLKFQMHLSAGNKRLKIE